MSKLLIGIGLISYQRAKEAIEVMNAILATIDKDKYDYKIICSVDHEYSEEYEQLTTLCGTIFHANVGIAMNKNIALMNLQSCDHVFIFEDDYKPMMNDWVDLYLNMHSETNIGLFNASSEAEYDKIKHDRSKFRTLNNGTLYIADNHVAQIMSITKDTLSKVGALDPRYKAYGYEHCDYTRRCIMAKAHPTQNYPTIEESYKYMKFMGVPNTSSPEERDGYIKYNAPIYNAGSPRILIPFTEIESILKQNGVNYEI